jgi:hypothetical protein
LAVAFNQLFWIPVAPITGVAAAFHGVSDLSIGPALDEPHFSWLRLAQRRPDRISIWRRDRPPHPGGHREWRPLLMAQISGIRFIFARAAFKSPNTGSMTPSLPGPLALRVIAVRIATRLRGSQALAAG